jgi:hypothetical protein
MCWSSRFCWSNWRDGEGVGGGFGWDNVNGNSTAKSLNKQTNWFCFIVIQLEIYPPIATIILTLTLYCTIIPRFSFGVLFRILFKKKYKN